jgi:hypothetical protein
MSPIPFIHGGVGLPDGERFEDAAEYYEITGGGRVIKKYGEPLPFSIEDEMTVSNIHRVIGNSLYEFYWSQLYRHEPRIRVDLSLRNLQPHEDPLPFDPDAVIRTYEQK